MRLLLRQAARRITTVTINAPEHHVRRLVHRLHAAVTLVAPRTFCIGGGLGLIDEIRPRTGRRLGHRKVRRQRRSRTITVLGQAFGSSKHQAPSTKEAPNTKRQKADRHRYPDLWSLEFEVSLELGAWSLELPALLLLFRSHRLIRQRQRQNPAIEKIIHLPGARTGITENRIGVRAVNVFVALSWNQKPRAGGEDDVVRQQRAILNPKTAIEPDRIARVVRH